MKEKLVERAQTLHGRRIRRDASLQTGQQLVYIAENLLDIEFGVFVLSQADGGFQQREMLVALHQT